MCKDLYFRHFILFCMDFSTKNKQNKETTQNYNYIKMFNITDIATLVLSVFVLVYVVKKVQVPFRRHTMNIYQYQMYTLVLMALLGKIICSLMLLVRSLLFLTTIGTIEISTSPRMVALIWSWPVFCI